MRFGLFFFGASTPGRDTGLETMLAAARAGDEAGLAFVSTPERHFNAFGGSFPNPAITGAALAGVTKLLQIRAGSLVSPLHHTLRIVEDWALVDNLSNGRAAVSFGSGWNVNDFVLATDAYEARRELMYEQIAAVSEIWRTGVTVATNPVGTQVELRLFPRPVQAELPVWVTSSGNVETFLQAGKRGFNLLTHLENHDLAGLAAKVRSYREARSAAGHDPEQGVVTLMQHTFVSDSADLRRQAESHLQDYLESGLVLERSAVRGGGTMSGGKAAAPGLESSAARRMIAHEASVRYARQHSLLGDIATCAQRALELERIGVDEVACLVDFVPDRDLLLAGMEGLAALAAQLADTAREQHRTVAVRRFLGR